MEVINESAIQIDRGTQFRARLNDDRVREYSEMFGAACEWPFDTPCEVFFDGSEYYLVDGFHRYHAARTAGFDGIVCNVRTGTLRDAIKFALGANAKHGLHRSNEDKRKAVAFVLADKEWSKLSSRMVAEMCGVSPAFVDANRKPVANGLQQETKRVGKDGKNFNPVANERQQKKEEKKPGPPKDAWEDVDEEPEPEKPIALTKDDPFFEEKDHVAAIHSLTKLGDEWLRKIKVLTTDKGGEYLAFEVQEIDDLIKRVKLKMRQSTFAHVCVDCKGNGKKCGKCKQLGWLCKGSLEFLDQRQKDLLGVA